MRRAAIYARFSTDLQSERSIEDQVTLCRSYATREGLDVVATFEDRARSGGSILGRDGLMQLMERAREGTFEILVVEALDRLSRDMEDLAGLHKRLSFLGIEIRAVHEGTVNTILVGLRGLVGQLYREDGAHKVRRGQAGRVRAGLAAGGITYGYAAVPGEPGKRTIAPDEAAVVLRIFRDYHAGQTARDIAHALNREGVKPPRGRTWNASTLNGNPERGSGILRNELYAGRLVWNKVRMIKDPDTGRRVSRPNPREQWQSVDVPELAIVPPELFDAVQDHKKAVATVHPSHQRRQRHMLSGLLRCAACGAGMAAKGRDKSGRVRIRCSADQENGTCPDPKTVYLDTVENAVLGRLKKELRDPVVIEEYLRTYVEERRRLAAAAIAQRSRIEDRIGEVSRELDRVVDALVKGHGSSEVLGPRSTALHEERKRLQAELAAQEEPTPLLSLHPMTRLRYVERIAEFQALLARGVQDGDTDPAALMREIVDHVVVRAREGWRAGVEVEIVGRLDALLADGGYPANMRIVGDWW
jgi:DNA invertase Pin-like site-specific DNA recombinase